MQGLALEIGHGDEGPARGLIDFVNRADVVVVESGSGFGLADEALAPFLVLNQVGRQKLQNDGAVELGIDGLVDHTHPAFAEFLDDLVMGDRLADHVSPSSPAAGHGWAGCSQWRNKRFQPVVG